MSERRGLGIGVWPTLVLVAACSPDAGTPQDPSLQNPSKGALRSEAADVVARVGDRSLSLSDLEASVRGGPRARDQRALGPGGLRAALERRVELLLVLALLGVIATHFAMTRRAPDVGIRLPPRAVVAARALEDAELLTLDLYEDMPRFGKLHCISNQVGKDLPKPSRVARDPFGSARFVTQKKL